MHSVNQYAPDSEIVLFIVFARKHLIEFEKLLNQLAFRNWKESRTIFLCDVDDQYLNSKPHIKASIKRNIAEARLAVSKSNFRYLVSNELNINENSLAEFGASKETAQLVSTKNLLRVILEARLKEWGLHWRRVKLFELRNWQFDDIKDRNIEEWLAQFDRIGEYRWVGEHLLRMFKVWTTDDIVQAFGSDAPTSTICIIRYENGKSADSIAAILRKKLSHMLGPVKIEEYREFLETGEDVDCDVFEDGNFTGVEVCDLIHNLQGNGGSAKCKPLANPSRMKSSKTLLKFAIGTDIGMHRIRETIEQLELAIEVSAGVQFNMLSESGLAKLSSGTLYKLDSDGKKVLSCSEDDIVPQAFIDEAWANRRDEAIIFCRNLGFELFKSYQEKKSKNWTVERLNDCALGAGNMAFVFSFAHSLPKSTLPMFWCHGTYKDQNGKEHKWLPLFPSAHQN